MAQIISVISSDEYRFFREIIVRIKSIYVGKKLWIFGAGTMGMQFFYAAQEMGLDIVGFYDNDSEKHGKIIEGIGILPAPSEPDKKSLLVVAMERSEGVCRQLLDAGFQRDKDFLLLYNIGEKKQQKAFEEVGVEDTLLLGDCGITSVSFEDTEKESLEDLLANEHKIVSFAVNGLYMRQYYEIIKACLEKGMSLHRVIVAVDMSFFEGHVHTLPKNQHADLFEMLSRDLPFTEGFTSLLYEREKTGSWLDMSSPRREYGVSEEKIRMEMVRHARFSYMYRLDEESESLDFLDRTLNLCKERGITFILMVLPVNYELIQNLINEDKFRAIYEGNTALLRRHFSSPHRLVDLSFFLSKEEFVSIRSVQEAVYEKGRKLLAERIRKEMGNVFS